MITLYIFAGIVIVLVIALAVLKALFEGGGDEEKAKYQYKRKNFFLTRAEHECYDALVEAVGQEYRIFAQVHLPTLVEHKIKGQDWRAALAHINRKSVDFVLCDKAYLSAKLAIELDDISHERSDRQERDREVERIMQDAGLPLLRLENHGRFNPSELARKIKESLGTGEADPQKEFRDRFAAMSEEQLVGAFNREVGNSGWTSSRAAYLAALRDEFNVRGYDYSAIGKEGFSLKNKVKLVDKTIVLVESSE